jgi:ATP adenylyltransferase
MDKLWAPWREKYVTKDIRDGKKADLFIRLFEDKKNDRKNLVLLRAKHSFAVFNIYPYNNGHMLIVPNRKVNDLSKLKKEEREDLFDLLELTKSLLEEVLKPDGFNIGINIGKAAGAGIPQHLHIHIVPRWNGDVNFMPVTATTKVISQSMTELYKQLKNAYTRRNRKNRK